MEQNVFSKPRPSQSLPREAFDLSKTLNYSFSNGMLLPIWSRPMLAGSKMKLDLNAFIRTNAVNSPAFTPISYHVDVFAVPLRLINSHWKAMKTQVSDVISSVWQPLEGRPTFSFTNLPSVSGAFLDSVFKFITSESTGVDALTEYDEFGYWSYPQRLRLFDLLDSSHISKEKAQVISSDGETNMHTWKFVAGYGSNLMRLCAYQKIYYDYYRNTSYEPNLPCAYNLDQFTQGTNTIAATPFALDYITQLHYVNSRKDLYRNIYPSLNYIKTHYSNVGASQLIPSNIPGFDYYPNVSETRVYPTSFADASTYGSFSRPFTTQSIRVAFALDKLLRLIAFTPQHIKDQLLVRFGVHDPAEQFHECVRLGSFSTDILLQEVTQTGPNADGDGVGLLGAKGVGSGRSGIINYTSTEDCLIMAVAYTLPRLHYDNNRVNHWNNSNEIKGFYVPEFMNMGLEPVYGYDLDQFGSRADALVGFRPRYSEYKTDVDTNHGEFRNGGTLSAFTTHGDSTFNTRMWEYGLDASYFKTSPRDLDSLFAETFDGNPDKDQFFGHVTVNCHMIQPLSVHGVPDLIL